MTRALLCPNCDAHRETTIAYCPNCAEVTRSYSYELTEREEFAAQRALEAERFTRTSTLDGEYLDETRARKLRELSRLAA